MRSADVAVVIPVFERPTIVLEALGSVAAQTAAPALVVVVDDGSADRTVPAVREWLRAAERPFEARVVVQEHRGASAARNRGLEEAGAHALVAFLDSDDQWPADFLERSVTALAAEPAAVAVSTDQRLYSAAAGGTAGLVALRSLAPLAGDATGWLIRNDGGLLSASLFRTDVVRRAGGFDEAIESGQDWKTALEISLRGRWLHAPGAAVEMGRSHLQRGAEAGHLSFRFKDRHRRWAELLEQFVLCHDGEPRVRADEYAPSLAMRWIRAARELAREGRLGEARACMRRSRHWWRRHGAWARVGATGVAALGLAVAERWRRNGRSPLSGRKVA